MPATPKNPFADYRPPDLDSIFSPEGKLEIAQFKAARLAETVQREMLEGDNLDDFMSGVCGFMFSYDCSRLEPYIVFRRSADELSFVGKAVGAGLKIAILERHGPKTDSRFVVGGEFDEERPRVANIVADMS